MAGAGPPPPAGALRQDGGPALIVVVRLASALRTHAGGVPRIEVDLPPPVTLGAVIDAVAEHHPAVGRRLRDESGALRRHVNLFVGSDDVRTLDGLDTVVPAGVEVAVLPAVSGGCGADTRSARGRWLRSHR